LAVTTGAISHDGSASQASLSPGASDFEAVPA
jgi:hypothetical protein